MRTSYGLAAVGVFLLFGTAMATLAGTLLIHPGTILDRAWVLNPLAHAELAHFGKSIGIALWLLAALLGVAATGWFTRRYWGWLLTLVVIATQLAGDAINFMRGDHVRGGVGFAIAGGLLFYLLRPEVRFAFPRSGAPRERTQV